jgi:hypothetical protein
MELVAFSPGTVTLTLRAEDSPAFDLSAPAGPTVSLSSPNTQLVLEVGVPGSTGSAATVAVGTTTTLAPGSSATVANVGTAYAAVFNFGIPRGSDGAQGPAGPAGTSGIVYATSPLAYNSGTQTISIDLSAYATQAWVDSQGYLQAGALTGYALQSWVTAGFYPLGSNPAGYLTSAALAGYETSAHAAATYFPIPTGNSTQYIAGDGTLITFPSLATANKLTATVYNQTGSTLTKGQVVYINGAHGNLPTVALSQANAESTSAGTYGLVSADIGNMSSGTIVIAGVIDNLATNAYADGDKLYLSPTTAGGYTTTKPSAPNHMVYVGVVTRAHPTQGTIQLRIANGFEVEELHDAAISSPTNNDLFVYESSTSLWKNKSFSTLGLATLASPTFTGDPKAPTPATADNDTSIATTAYVKNQGYITTATATANFYPLSSNPAGYLTSSALTGYALLNGSSAFSVTGASIKSLDSSDNFAALDQGVLNFGNGSTPSGIVINGSSITFADATVQTTAAVSGIPDAPSDGNTYGRNNGAWVIAGGGSGSGTLTMSSGQLYDTSTANFVPDLTLSGTLSAGTVTGGSNATLNSSGLTLAASSGAVVTFADSTTQSSAGITASAVASTYQTLAGMSSYAPKASPALTGVPTSTTAAADTNTTQIATTAFVVGQASSTTPATNGTAAVGTSLKYARADHVHASSAATDIQVFGGPSSSGTFTWTKPANAKLVRVYCISGGGGGGSGARQATTSGRSGGSAGSGGQIVIAEFVAAALSATVTVTVGIGANGGTAITADNTNGNPSTFPSSGISSFGSYTANTATGVAGAGGTTTSATGGTAIVNYSLLGGNAIGSSGTGGNGNTAGPSAGGTLTLAQASAAGGGGGGGAAASSTTNQFGSAGGYRSSTILGSTTPASGGQGTGSTAPGNGLDTTYSGWGGMGGGGGGYRTALAGQAGGAGGWPAGGGGGGSGSDNGFASGAGGKGGNGAVIVMTFC